MSSCFNPWLRHSDDISPVEGFREQIARSKHCIPDELPKLYSQEILNNLFCHLHAWTEYDQKDLEVTQQTAAMYLDTVAENGFVDKHQPGRNNYYINTEPVRLFLDVSGGL